MKLGEFNNLKTQSNFESERINYSLSNNGKIYDILFNHVYKDKIRAVLREIGANAQDAHTIAGVKKPIEIILPNEHVPTIKIRDYGNGLSKEEMKDIYINKGNSLSGESNETIGCYGIGAGAVFCYANSFITNSYYKGKKYTYIHTRDESGIPHANFVGETETQETGFEVEISCNTKDIRDIRKAAEDIFKWFEPQPNIIPPLELKRNIVYEDDNCIICDDCEGARILMGGITYKINPTSISSHSGHFDKLYFKLLLKDLIIKVKIGEVDVDAGREGIQYTERTKRLVYNKCSQIIESFREDTSKKIEKASSLYEANIIFGTIHNTLPIPLQTAKYKDHIVNGKMPLSENVPTVHEKHDGTLTSYRKILLHNRIAFAWDDVKQCKLKSAKNLITELDKEAVYLVSDKTPELKKTIEEYEAPVLKLSDYFVPPKKQGGRISSGTTVRILDKVLEYNPNGFTRLSSYIDSQYWKRTEINFKDGGVYVPIYKYGIINKIGEREDAILIKRLGISANRIGIDVPKKIYGVKKVKRFEKSPNWRNYFDVLADNVRLFIKYNKDFVQEYCDYKSFNGFSWSNSRADNILRLELKGTAGELIRRLKYLSHNKHKYRDLEELCKLTHNEIEIKSDINERFNKVNERYHFLSIINNAYTACSELVTEINKMENK